jgi:hypothetical protein
VTGQSHQPLAIGHQLKRRTANGESTSDSHQRLD